MAIIGEAITIPIPAEKIFDYIGTPTNLPEFWPSLIEVKNVQSLPGGRYKAQYAYKMAGIQFRGIGEYTEVVPNKSLVIVTKGGISSVMTWTFRTRVNITRVNLTIDYKVPIPLLGKLAEAVVVKMNEQEIVLMLSNLRARLAFSPRNT
ncbi:SRPBCC family protein [Chloroflexota bacterium]